MNQRNFKPIILGTVLLLCLGFAREASTAEIPAKLTSAANRFAFKLFPQLVEREAEKNIFTSPPGISLALAMVYNGTTGKTQEEMSRALEWNGLTIRDINQGYASLMETLASADPNITLMIANSLWGQEDLTFKKRFLSSNRKYFDAEITTLNFQKPEATRIINSWVKTKTQGTITEIVDKIDPATILFLMNAIYFKGQWQVKFEKGRTWSAPFTLLNGIKKTLPFMSQDGKYKYLKKPEFQAVALPYGQGRFQMYLFLPDRNSSLQKFIKTLTEENWQQWLQQFRWQAGHISLPRFRLNYEVELNTALKAMGMDRAFDHEKAEFSRMISARAKAAISTVKHKSFLEVNEEGTEAAAVTTVGITMTAVSAHPPFLFEVDRPFFCAVVDNQTGIILFMGAVLDPQ